MTRLIVFDCDGTLVDSQHVIVNCMRAAFGDEGVAPPAPSSIRSIVGLALPHAVSVLAPEAATGLVSRLVNSYRERFALVQRSRSISESLYPGALETLEALREAGYVLAIATGKGRQGLDATLSRHQIARFFVALATADDAPGKPDPGMLLKILEETDVSPSETIMVGDATFDMQMAIASGVVPVGVAWGYHSRQELILAGAVSVLDEFEGLPQFVSSIPDR